MSSNISSGDATFGEWRKRRAFMDVARTVLAFNASGLYEDSLFSELGVAGDDVEKLRAHLEKSFKLELEQEAFLSASISLHATFEHLLKFDSFLSELNEPAPVLTVATLGVPVWLAEKQMFVLQDGSSKVELTYDPVIVYGREVVRFRELAVSPASATQVRDDLFSFALGELVRKDTRVACGKVNDLRAFVRENPGWMPFIVGA